MESITSVRNERIKEWAELKTPKGRKNQSRYLIEGIKSVEEALFSGAPIEAILLEESAIDTGKLDAILNESVSRGIEMLSVTNIIFEKVADTKTPQGALAIALPYRHEFEGLLQKQNEGLFLLLDRISDPGNLGTLIRTADASLVTGVVIGHGGSDLYNPKVVRATMGSLFHMPVFEGDLLTCIRSLRDQGYKIFGTATGENANLYSQNLTGKIAIVVGSESHGIHPDLVGVLDGLISIPMPGRAESLNAAIAGSVILYEALRQRSQS